jgi:hypothetical protein
VDFAEENGAQLNLQPIMTDLKLDTIEVCKVKLKVLPIKSVFFFHST